jgi:hypothetical protein
MILADILKIIFNLTVDAAQTTSNGMFGMENNINEQEDQAEKRKVTITERFEM